MPSLEKELTLYFSNIKTNLAPIVVHIVLFRNERRLWCLLTSTFSLPLFLLLIMFKCKS